MDDEREVKVKARDLRWVLDGGGDKTHLIRVKTRFQAALDALGPEPCGHPSVSWSLGAPRFRCVAPKGHHDFDSIGRPSLCCAMEESDPTHCGDAHVPPAGVWAD